MTDGPGGGSGTGEGRMTDGERLDGGFVTEVRRVGDTVRRVRPPRAAYVEALLEHLERVGYPGAPRFLGTDGRGRQVLGFLAGHVPWREPADPATRADPALTALARLLRGLHDACAGTGLAGDAETVCHRDLSPKNTVYRDTGTGLLPVAFLDWDLAGPGRRIEDVAFAAWHWADLGAGADPAELGRRARVLCDGYAAPLPRTELVDVMLAQLDGTWRGIDAGADRGEPAMLRLRALGVVDTVRAWHAWLGTHRHATETALLGG
ncbi:phosphotransferase [Micromonospora cathayae]|uniref:Phosphotransferase n=1 Tax=Micromonospora cathayae TaxID=3028804 RepID=A0ABY7ZMZ1_9ACTN|nr:phosphotransferase [Micromonospora sp. HUAS 3]WDZ84349.1 phosphotransferase [Micromonospora sp. HUAS 3]